MPCFNEAVGLESTLLLWIGTLKETVGAFEILVINDGSSDGSGRILDKLRRDNRNLRVFHQLNVGHGRSVRRGYELARGQYVAQVDLNGSFEVMDFLRLWEVREDYRMVLGRRTHRIDSWVKRGTAGLSRRTVQWLFDVEMYDPDVPFRIMNGEILRQLLPLVQKSQVNPNLALSVLFKRLGKNSVGEVPVPFRFRAHGKSRSGLLATLSATGTVVAELINLKLASRNCPSIDIK